MNRRSFCTVSPACAAWALSGAFLSGFPQTARPSERQGEFTELFA